MQLNEEEFYDLEVLPIPGESSIPEESPMPEESMVPFINYDNISAAVASAMPTPETLDADLDSISMEGVLMLIIALILGVILVRSKT